MTGDAGCQLGISDPCKYGPVNSLIKDDDPHVIDSAGVKHSYKSVDEFYAIIILTNSFTGFSL